MAASSGANFHQPSRDQEHQPVLSSSAPEHSSRSFLDPLGIVEKVPPSLSAWVHNTGSPLSMPPTYRPKGRHIQGVVAHDPVPKVAYLQSSESFL